MPEAGSSTHTVQCVERLSMKIAAVAHFHADPRRILPEASATADCTRTQGRSHRIMMRTATVVTTDAGNRSGLVVAGPTGRSGEKKERRRKRALYRTGLRMADSFNGVGNAPRLVFQISNTTNAARCARGSTSQCQSRAVEHPVFVRKCFRLFCRFGCPHSVVLFMRRRETTECGTTE